jgi:hypothetical protein
VEDFDHDTDLQAGFAEEADAAFGDGIEGFAALRVGGRVHASAATSRVGAADAIPHEGTGGGGGWGGRLGDGREASDDVGGVADRVGTVSDFHTSAAFSRRSDGFLVGGVDGEEGVAVAEDGADRPFQSIFGFGGDVGGDEIHALTFPAFFSFVLKVVEVAAEDLTDDAMRGWCAVDGGHGEAEFLGRAEFRCILIIRVDGG